LRVGVWLQVSIVLTNEHPFLYGSGGELAVLLIRPLLRWRKNYKVNRRYVPIFGVSLIIIIIIMIVIIIIIIIIIIINFITFP